MIGSVILPGTKAEEWPRIREEIRGRIMKTLGNAPEGARGRAPAWEEMERYEKHGLTHVRIRYHVVADEWHEGVCVLPTGGEKACPAPAVLCIHGTNEARGKWSMIDPEGTPKRAYGIELARRGYVTMSVDQMGFGDQRRGRKYPEVYAELYERYPEWTVDDRHLLDHQRALDAMETMDFIAKGPFGAIGNSLGGRYVMYVTGLDERIGAAVSSTGIFPHMRGVVYPLRSATAPRLLNLSSSADAIQRAPWDYHELIALCAPRALLALEAHNDHCNPDVWPGMQCFYQGSEVYKLLGHPERLTMITHGEEHDTPDHLREFAYVWLDRFLKNGK
jgi:dienelactone hydrolase